MAAQETKLALEELRDRLEQCLNDIITLKDKVDELAPFAECELNDAALDMDKVIAGVNAALRDPKEPRMHPDGWYYEPEEDELQRLGEYAP